MPIRSALTLVACLFLVGCASGGGSSVPVTPSEPKIRVTLVDGPAPELKALRLRIEKVEIHASGSADATGWLTLGEPKRTVDLLTLRNGVVETLVPGAALGVGHYEQLRLLLGEPNEVVLADGTLHPLEVPSGLNTGIKVPLSFEVAAGTQKDLFIDFDGARSIQMHTTGSKERYILRPVVRAIDKVVSGGMSGTLSGPSGPLANALVLGQIADAGGRLQVLRTVPTKADGTYVLDLMPLNLPITLAALPAGMVPRATDPITLTTAAPTAIWSPTFVAAAATGTLSGTVTPAAGTDQADVAEILAQLITGSASRWVIVAMVPVTAGTTATFQAALPPGTYQVQVRRSTTEAGGTITNTLSPLSATVTITSAQTTPVSVAF